MFVKNMYEYLRKFVALEAIWNALNYKNLFMTFAPMFVSISTTAQYGI